MGLALKLRGGFLPTGQIRFAYGYQVTQQTILAAPSNVFLEKGQVRNLPLRS